MHVFRPFPALPNRGRHIREYGLVEDAEYVTGAVIVFDSGLIDEANANPAAILGFSLEPTVRESGQDFNPGRRLIAVAEANSTFWISGGEQGSPDFDEVLPLVEHIGETFGLTKHEESGIWYLDMDKDGANQRAIVEEIDVERKLFEIRILDANRVLD